MKDKTIADVLYVAMQRNMDRNAKIYSALFYTVRMLLLCFFCTPANAQKLSIETMDSVAKLVNIHEKGLENRTYSDGKHKYTLSFPEESFGFNYENGKAWKVVYKTNGMDTYLAFTENIDLSKVTGFTWDGSTPPRVLMHFPKGMIKTSVSKNEGEVYVIDEEYLEFFCTKDLLKMVTLLAGICHDLKRSQGNITQAQVRTFEKNFLTLMELPPMELDSTLVIYNNFVEKNAESLYVPIVKEYISSFNDVLKYWKEEEIVAQFSDSLCKAYFYKPDIFTPQQLEAHNPNTKSLIKRGNIAGENTYRNSNAYARAQVGPYAAEFEKEGFIYNFLINVSNLNAIDCNGYFNATLRWLESKIPKSFIEVSETGDRKSIHIVHRKENKSVCITFKYSKMSYGGCMEELIFKPYE